MLVLSRKIGEAVNISEHVKVYVLEIRGGVVRLGFEAPPHIRIHREEVCQRIVAQALAEETARERNRSIPHPELTSAEPCVP